MAEAKTQPSQEFEKVLKDSATEVASFERHDKPLLERIQHMLHSNPALVPLIVLVLSVAIFGALLGSKFFSPFSLSLILQQVAIVGIVGAAQTLVVLTAGIDLSVGAIMVLCSVVMGQFTFRYGIPAPISILCGFAVGGLIGYVNGFLVAKIKLPPFIVTLGMWQIVLAANFLYSRNETIRSQDIEAQAPLLQLFGHRIGRRRVADARRHRHGAAGARAELHPDPHRLGPARLRHRRRSGRGRALRRRRSTRC